MLARIEFVIGESLVNLQTLLMIIAAVLILIFWKLSKIEDRLKERFPTEKEADRK